MIVNKECEQRSVAQCARAREPASRDLLADSQHGASRRRRRQEQLQTASVDVDEDRLVWRQVQRQPGALLLVSLRSSLQRAQIRVGLR